MQWSLASAAVTVSGTAPSAYTQAVRADGASHLWKLGDTGPAFVDAAGFADGTSSSTAFGAAGAMADNDGDLQRRRRQPEGVHDVPRVPPHRSHG